MRYCALLAVIVLLNWSGHARAEQGMPSQARLAEMGLAGMEILSDCEAETVWVSGRPPNRWGDLYPFVKGVSRLEPERSRMQFFAW